MTINYNLGIPNASNNPSTDQPNMLTNNNNIASYVAIDHVAFNTAGSGQHKQVTFNNVAAPGVPSDPTSFLFTSNDANSHPILNFLNSQNITNTAAAPGRALLFGGIIIAWGTSATIANPIPFPFPFPNNCFSMVVTSSSGAYVNSFAVTGLTKNNFSIARNGGGVTGFYYIAIGN